MKRHASTQKKVMPEASEWQEALLGHLDDVRTLLRAAELEGDILRVRAFRAALQSGERHRDVAVRLMHGVAA